MKSALRRRLSTLRRVAKWWILREICLCATLALLASPALASPVDVRCARLAAKARAELQARARLLLLGAGMDAARVAIGCDTSAAWLVWVDGEKTSLDETAGLVEGALDAIESRLEASRKPASGSAITVDHNPPPNSLPSGSSAPRTGATDPFIEEDRGSTKPPPDADREPHGEGGVGLAAVTEFWSDATLVGPRLDVGLALGRRLAFVISEGARFGVGSQDHGQVMLFDLQAGIAFGAPYVGRSLLGAVLLLGTERSAVSSGRLGDGAWGWSGSATLGLRASVAAGDLDLWLGADGIARSATLGTGGPSGISIPSVSGLVSFGGFLPAFARTQGTVPPFSASLTRHAE